jgi:hypothetical protein
VVAGDWFAVVRSAPSVCLGDGGLAIPSHEKVKQAALVTQMNIGLVGIPSR